MKYNVAPAIIIADTSNKPNISDNLLVVYIRTWVLLLWATIRAIFFIFLDA